MIYRLRNKVGHNDQVGQKKKNEKIQGLIFWSLSLSPALNGMNNSSLVFIYDGCQSKTTQ